MKKSFTLILILAMLFGATACSKQKFIDSSFIVGSYDSSSEKFGYLDEQFKNNNVFTDDEAKNLSNSQAVILSLIEDFRDDSLGGGVKVQNFDVYIRQFTKHYLVIKKILDKHISNYPTSTRIIYKDTVAEIDDIFSVCNKLIQEYDEGELNIELISKYADKLMNAVGPLMSMAI